MEIVPYISIGKRGFKSKVPFCEIINCILYKLKTGVQWHLPVKHLFSGITLHYKTVFDYYRKWCKEGIFQHCWVQLLKKNRPKLDLSSGAIDLQNIIS